MRWEGADPYRAGIPGGGIVFDAIGRRKKLAIDSLSDVVIEQTFRSFNNLMVQFGGEAEW